MMPAGSELRIESLAGIPLYNGDVEAESGIPPAVSRLKDAIAAADGLLLVTPEYNNGIPGVTTERRATWHAAVHAISAIQVGARCPTALIRSFHRAVQRISSRVSHMQVPSM